VLILGASGGTGAVLVTEALARGHVVTALSRNPATALEAAVRPRVVAGNVLDSRCMESLVADQDVVIWAVGARAGERAAHVCAVGTKNVLWAMETAGVRRFICESAFGVGESRRGGPYARILRIVLRARVRDKEMQERSIFTSSVDWVIVRPTILTNGPATGRYRVGTDLQVGLFPRISRADVADFMLRQIEDRTFLRLAVGITG
jgi:putative NADH-flavin reductase